MSLAETIEKQYARLTKDPASAPRCFIGFDGVTDEIIEAIATRENFATYAPFRKIADFGQRIVDASGKSCNIELIVKQKKIGGNAPILTDSLLHGGHRITFAGTIGAPDKIETLFQPMASRCEVVFPLGPSAHSDAIEFEDGKVILGKLENFKIVSYLHLLHIIGKPRLIEIFDRSELFVSANWTMLVTMNEIWKKIIEEIVPALSAKKRWLFVDLADPAKRTDEDIREALKLLKKLGDTYTVIQGLNEAEALRMAKTLGLPVEENMLTLAEKIQKKSGLQEIVIHATAYACAANARGKWRVEGPYTPKPFITTGAGDNFNAGYCNALLYGLSTEECLRSGVATSGYYVRTGKSPSMTELASFLRSL